MSVEVGRKVVVTNVDWMGHIAELDQVSTQKVRELDSWHGVAKPKLRTQPREDIFILLAWTSTLHLELNQTLEACLS